MANVLTHPKRPADMTRDRILDAAVHHFGLHGYRGASLRGILADAGANGAAANYHFGSKAGLYEATIRRYFDRTRARRKSLLDQAERAPIGSERLEALTRAYIRPHIELILRDGEHDYGRLMTRALGESEDIAARVLAREIGPLRLRYRDALRICCPEVPSETLTRGIHLVVGVLVHAPWQDGFEPVDVRPTVDEHWETALEEAVAFACGGLIRLFGLERTVA